MLSTLQSTIGKKNRIYSKIGGYIWILNNLFNFMKHMIIKFSELDQQHMA